MPFRLLLMRRRAERNSKKYPRPPARRSAHGPALCTAKVTASVSGTPTGSVTFNDGTTALGTAALNASGLAALDTSTLAVGVHTITAVYSGDSIDLASTSGSMSETVNAPNFSIAANPSTVTVLSGQSASYALTITPDGNFTNPISFSCSGLPELASCSFSPASVTPNSGVVTTTMTITTAGSASGMLVPISPEDDTIHRYAWPASLWFLAFAIALFLASERESALQVKRRFLLATATLAIVGAIGCSSSHAPATPAGTSQVMVQGTGQNGTGKRNPLRFRYLDGPNRGRNRTIGISDGPKIRVGD